MNIIDELEAEAISLELFVKIAYEEIPQFERELAELHCKVLEITRNIADIKQKHAE